MSKQLSPEHASLGSGPFEHSFAFNFLAEPKQPDDEYNLVRLGEINEGQSVWLARNRSTPLVVFDHYREGAHTGVAIEFDRSDGLADVFVEREHREFEYAAINDEPMTLGRALLVASDVAKHF